ncbi:uncharacterized protein LOC143344582 [Colletes latitarsis]|uniref:uncharacterized protein LOC143344582 n=1 Tax=Colletes latitarsis TaxID=2605962 RepID=UPI0040357C50
MEVSSRTVTEKDVGSSLAIAPVKEAGTAPGLSDVGSDKLVETDTIERAAKYVGDSSDKIAETASKMGKRAHEPIGEQDVSGDRSDIADLRDECDPSCSRRVSRSNKKRKLEERQKLVDAYLLNRGTRYFDDVCTCSLSCILYAMKNDSFVTSILTSVALFTLGLKLCSELDAWYLPTRLS